MFFNRLTILFLNVLSDIRCLVLFENQENLMIFQKYNSISILFFRHEIIIEDVLLIIN